MNKANAKATCIIKKKNIYIAQTQASHFTNPNKNLQGEGEKQSKPQPQPRTVSSFPHETLQQQQREGRKRKNTKAWSDSSRGRAGDPVRAPRSAPAFCRPPRRGRGAGGGKRYLCRRPVPKRAGRETREAGGSRQTSYGSAGPGAEQRRRRELGPD